MPTSLHTPCHTRKVTLIGGAGCGIPLHTCATILMLNSSMTGQSPGSGSTQSRNICQTTCHNDKHRFYHSDHINSGHAGMVPTAAYCCTIPVYLHKHLGPSLVQPYPSRTTIIFEQQGGVPVHRYTPLPCRVSLDKLLAQPRLQGRSPHILRMSVRPSVVHSLAVAHGRFTYTS